MLSFVTALHIGSMELLVTSGSDFESSGVSPNFSNGSSFRLCSKDFFLDETSGLCEAECGEWSQLPDTTAAWFHPLIIMSYLLQILGAVVVVILSCISYKTM